MEIWKGRIADNEFHGGKHPDEADFLVKKIFSLFYHLFFLKNR
jgi:hypothetical protein